MKLIILHVAGFALMNDFTGEPRTFETKYEAARYAQLSALGWTRRDWSVKEIEE